MNPLERIRSKAPADMTDDELGVAVLLEIGCKYVSSWQFEDAGFVGHLTPATGHMFHPPLMHGPEFSPVWQDSNPAEYYDALLPIVREWCGRSPDRMIALTLGLDRGLMESHLESVQDMRRDCADWRFDETLATSWCLLQLSPRQLAEAFVTAAREVG